MSGAATSASRLIPERLPAGLASCNFIPGRPALAGDPIGNHTRESCDRPRGVALA